MALQVHQDRAEAVAATEREVIYAQKHYCLDRALWKIHDAAMVLREVCMPKRAQSLAPPFPHVASPMDCRASQSRIVIRAQGFTNWGIRSVNTLRSQRELWQ